MLPPGLSCLSTTSSMRSARRRQTKLFILSIEARKDKGGWALGPRDHLSLSPSPSRSEDDDPAAAPSCPA